MSILCRYIAPIGLFLVTYTAGVAYLWHTNHTGSLASDLADNWQQKTASTVASYGAGSSGANKLEAESSLSQPAGNNVEAVQSMASVASDASESVLPRDGLSEETREEIAKLSQQAVGAATLAERANAIVRLRNAAKTPQTVEALAMVLSADEAPRNRLFAVTALRTVGLREDDDGSVRRALGRAVNDADPRVSARAGEALEAISRAIDHSESPE